MRLPKCVFWGALFSAIISGCSTTPEMIQKGDVQLGMSLTDFNNTMYWGRGRRVIPGRRLGVEVVTIATFRIT